MARPSRPSIVEFRKRLEWLLRCPLDLTVKGRVETLTDLRNKIAERLDRNSGLNERTWSRYLSTGKPDKHILTALHDLYPRLRSDPDLLTCEWSLFCQLTSGTDQAFERWRAATQLFSTSRATVERFGKKAYSDLDDLQGFPLIGRIAWLPEEPVLMTETSNDRLRSTTTFDRSQSQELRLDQLNTPYATLKIASLHRKKAPPFNGDCFIVKDIRNDNGGMHICFGTGKYFDYLNTCEAHAAMLADLVLRGINPGEHTSVEAAMAASGWTRENLLDWNSRTSFAGVNCLLIVKGIQANPVFYLHRRGTKTIEAQGVWHVIPAGGHQPLNRHFVGGEERIWHTAVRELLEELFQCEELAEHGVDHADHFRHRERTREKFSAIVKSGAAQFYFLGVGLDPATTKPEVLCAIVLDWAKAREAYQKDSYRQLEEGFRANWEGEIHPLPLSIDALLETASKPRRGETMLPAGAACLNLAARHYHALGLG